MVASASEIYGLVKTKMSYKVTPPDLRNSKSYVLFRKENEVREITTPAPEEKRGAVSTVLLPNKFDRRKTDEMFENICSELKIVSGRVPGVSKLKRFLPAFGQKKPQQSYHVRMLFCNVSR